MRWSLRLLLSLALLTGLALPSAAQPAPAPPVTSPADLQRLLDSVVATGAPGAIGAVEDGGRAIRGVLALATDNELLFPPGTAWSYSNTNYAVAGLLIERVTGTSVARQLQRRLIRPLGMRHTWFPTDTAALPPPRLRGYMPLDDQPPLVDADITRFNPSFFWASGALVSNVDDLDRFYDALFDGRLLPRRLLAEMLTPVDTGAPGAAYGLGLEIYTLPCGAVVAGHTGPCPATTRARSGCSATTRTPAWSPTSTRPRTRCTRPCSAPWSSCSAT
jgi:CubicO group peptidase (beta-lactamase class C family)